MTAPSRSELTAREALVATARAMNTLGINRARAGNVSVRWREAGFSGFLVTPSGLAYDRIGAADMVALHLHGTPRDADAPVPSSEWRFHAAIYDARADAGAIVHAHSPFATALACHARSIPAFHYMVAKMGGPDIRCAPYARFGSVALATAAVAALQDRRACLLAQHGAIAIGRDLAHALETAVELESLAELYWRALQIGDPPLLSADEMTAVAGQFARYGQPVQGA